MNLALSIIQIIISLSVVGFVLLQPPTDDAAGGSTTATKVTRRGWDRFMFTITISVAIIFVVYSFFRMIAPDIF